MFRIMFPKLGKLIFVLVCTECLSSVQSDSRQGPDPWDVNKNDLKSNSDENVPPDLKIPLKKSSQPNNSLGNGEWFFRRILNIILKGGQVQKNDDNSIAILLKMKLSPKQWEVMDELLKSKIAFTDDTYRRMIGYIEEAIQPTITDKISLVWTEYIQLYLIEYKFYITWILAIIAISWIFVWLWTRMSHKHLIILLLFSLYLYEVFVSYKEAEKKELDSFLSALNSCSWKFWSSNCDVPKPDPLIFLKHMNPMKIGIRMFTSLVTEPMITLSDTVKTMVQGMTDGLWYPFDKIMYGILILSLNVLMLILLIMVVFNYIFNIPFNLSYLGVSLGVPQHNRNTFTRTTTSHNVENVDRISGPTLDRLLDVFSRALPVPQNNNHQKSISNYPNTGMRRSASTGRLTESMNLNNTEITFDNRPRKRNISKVTRPVDGSGDAR